MQLSPRDEVVNLRIKIPKECEEDYLDMQKPIYKSNKLYSCINYICKLVYRLKSRLCCKLL